MLRKQKTGIENIFNTSIMLRKQKTRIENTFNTSVMQRKQKIGIENISNTSVMQRKQKKGFRIYLIHQSCSENRKRDLEYIYYISHVEKTETGIENIFDT